MPDKEPSSKVIKIEEVNIYEGEELIWTIKGEDLFEINTIPLEEK
jgi:hypothetical protein